MWSLLATSKHQYNRLLRVTVLAAVFGCLVGTVMAMFGPVLISAKRSNEPEGSLFTPSARTLHEGYYHDHDGSIHYHHDDYYHYGPGGPPLAPPPPPPRPWYGKGWGPCYGEGCYYYRRHLGFLFEDDREEHEMDEYGDI